LEKQIEDSARPIAAAFLVHRSSDTSRGSRWFHHLFTVGWCQVDEE